MNFKNRVERSEYVKYAARELHVDERVLWEALQDAGLQKTLKPSRAAGKKTVPQKLSARAQIEHQLIVALIQNPTLISYVKSQFEYQHFTEPRFAKIAQSLWEADTVDTGEQMDIQVLISESTDEALETFISSTLLGKTPPPNLQARVDGCLIKLRGFLMQDLEQRVRSHALAEGADERETLEQLVKLSNERRALRGHDAREAHDKSLNEEGVDDGTLKTRLPSIISIPMELMNSSVTMKWLKYPQPAMAIRMTQVKVYMREMGKFKLLDKAQEVELAKQIQAGHRTVHEATFSTALAITEIRKLFYKIITAKKRASDIIDMRVPNTSTQNKEKKLPRTGQESVGRTRND